jgi:TonB family protein
MVVASSANCRINRSTGLSVALFVLCYAVSSHAQTNFPSTNRTLSTPRPPTCQEWKAPLPERRVDVVFPSDAKGLKGEAALLVRIDAEGRFVGVVDATASEEPFGQAAEESVKQWSFQPAKCNGVAIAADSRIDFKFKRDDGITYKTGGYLSK